jgi:hypothetical protein
VQGTLLCHPEPVGQDRAVLADLERHAGPCNVQTAPSSSHANPDTGS